VQNHPAARAARVLIFVVLALVAVACGGSDAADSSTAVVDETQAIEADTVATGALDDLTTKPPVGEDLLGEFDELIVTDVIVGDGDEAQLGSTVSMMYVGVLASDGTEFDASWNSGTPFDFTLGQGQVIAGWDEGIVGMKVGGRRILQIPSAMAYGSQARGDIIGADADLVFIVDLLGATPPPEPAPEIADEYLGSFDELNIIDLVEGEGRAVQVGDILSVDYVGVDAETGEEFDSSWAAGFPFRLSAGKSKVIQGWNEGLIGMKAGGERILQIPSALAYGEGDLVFRVHLREVTEAPYAHTVTFEGPAPTEIQTETITEGTGDAAKAGDTVIANIAVLYYSTSEIIQSTWETGQPAQLALVDDTLLPGLSEAVIGIKVGETRQVIIPAEMAFPEGIPDDAGIEADDALVFIIEPITIALPNG
jgi:peptidylprolyl isomerase